MRALVGIGLLIAAAILMVFALINFVCDLSRQWYQPSPELDSRDGWDVDMDENSNAFNDLHSAL
jgi:hypothetical protein